jgi:omega-6 fatty acid desaturase (delta-12 desaturase)
LTGIAVSREGADLRRAVEPYVGPDARRASFQLITTLALLAGAMTGAHLALQWSLPVALLFVLPTAGLLVRVFVLMHDCAHGSFLPSRSWNDLVGFLTGVLTITPFTQWRRDHALHHASSGDLNRRGHGDIPTLTLREYLAKSPWDRFRYRLVRHPLVLLFVGPIHLALGQRFRGRSKATGSPQVSSVWWTNIAIVASIAAACVAFGWQTVIVAYVIPYYIAAMAGIWLFYVQHQFEDAYWASHEEWNYFDSALRGSSHVRLPRLLAWFTGDIGLHHVHHVAPRIPNFRLQACHDENAVFHASPVVSLRSGLAALRLALWDEDRKQLVRFRDASTPRSV